MKRRIALFLTVMLVFCTLSTDAVLSRDVRGQIEKKSQCSPVMLLEHLPAGEFFTDLLLEGQRQSVMEVSADWQSVLRAGETMCLNRGGVKGTGLFDVAPEIVTGYRRFGGFWRPEHSLGPLHCREIIVCYIHNQDGEKDRMFCNL